MKSESVAKARIGYLGFSEDCSHIGDRRRFACYAKIRGIDLRYDTSSDLDILVVTPLRDLRKILRTVTRRTNLVLDLVDGYLHEKPGFIKDFGRGILRNSSTNLKGLSRYSDSLIEFISQSNTVVVGTVEQAEIVRKINPMARVHVILDYHHEIQAIDSNQNRRLSQNSGKRFLWEGQSTNLKHLLGEIDNLLYEDGADSLSIVTNLEHYRIANKYLKVKSKNYLHARIRRVDARRKIKLVKWSPENLYSSALEASVAIIPIDLSDRFALAKPENKLLIMWRLGLPTFVSPTPAYSRVLTDLNLTHYLVHGDWSEIPNLQEIQSNWEEDSRVVRSYLDDYYSRQAISRRWDLALSEIKD